MLEGGLALGTFTASLLLVAWNLKKQRGRLVFAALCLGSILLVLFSLVELFSLLVFLAGFMGFVMMFVYLPTVTMVQEKTDKDKLGRVMSIISLASSGFEPIAFGLISLLIAAAFPIQTVLTITGVVSLVLSLLLIWKSKHFRQID